MASQKMRKPTFRVLTGQFAHERTLSDRGETDKATIEVSIQPYCTRETTYTLAAPVRATSKPAAIPVTPQAPHRETDMMHDLPPPPPPPPPDGVNSSRFSFASLAFNCPVQSVSRSLNISIPLYPAHTQVESRGLVLLSPSHLNKRSVGCRERHIERICDEPRPRFV